MFKELKPIGWFSQISHHQKFGHPYNKWTDITEMLQQISLCFHTQSFILALFALNIRCKTFAVRNKRCGKLKKGFSNGNFYLSFGRKRLLQKALKNPNTYVCTHTHRHTKSVKTGRSCPDHYQQEPTGRRRLNHSAKEACSSQSAESLFVVL